MLCATNKQQRVSKFGSCVCFIHDVKIISFAYGAQASVQKPYQFVKTRLCVTNSNAEATWAVMSFHARRQHYKIYIRGAGIRAETVPNLDTGPMDLRIYGPMDLWTYEPVDLWTCGPMAPCAIVIVWRLFFSQAGQACASLRGRGAISCYIIEIFIYYEMFIYNQFLYMRQLTSKILHQFTCIS